MPVKKSIKTPINPKFSGVAFFAARVGNARHSRRKFRAELGNFVAKLIDLTLFGLYQSHRFL